jgi:hypothetical protein
MQKSNVSFNMQFMNCDELLILERGSIAPETVAVSGTSGNLIRPDVSKMIVYDPRNVAGTIT